jgi:hypothetical protein
MNDFKPITNNEMATSIDYYQSFIEKGTLLVQERIKLNASGKAESQNQEMIERIQGVQIRVEEFVQKSEEVKENVSYMKGRAMYMNSNTAKEFNEALEKDSDSNNSEEEKPFVHGIALRTLPVELEGFIRLIDQINTKILELSK